MEKMKSALEIALEKADSLQKKGEKKETDDLLEEQKYFKAAQALGRSFLQGKVKINEVKESIDRYPQHLREKSISSFIIEIINNLDINNTPEILKAISLLNEDENAKKTCAAAEEQYGRYKTQLKEKISGLRENAERSLHRQLAQEGITGSAIAGFNIKNTDQWTKISLQVQKEYEAFLQEFRETILNRFTTQF